MIQRIIQFHRPSEMAKKLFKMRVHRYWLCPNNPKDQRIYLCSSLWPISVTYLCDLSLFLPSSEHCPTPLCWPLSQRCSPFVCLLLSSSCQSIRRVQRLIPFHPFSLPFSSRVNGLHSYRVFLTSGHSKCFTILPHNHTFTHWRQWSAMQGDSQLVGSS